MAYQLEKLMNEQADQLKESDKEPLEKAITKVREKSAEDDPQALKAAIDELEAASHAFSKTIYEKAGEPGADDQAATDSEAETASEADNSSGDDDAIDAEFEVKDA